MNSDEFEPFVNRFKHFVKPYVEAAGKDRANVEIKINHTLRVLELARAIAKAEKFDAHMAHLTHLSALFHDTGRFPQYQKHGVFNDASSENHASLGVKTLLRENLLQGLPRADKRVILGAVFLHNVRHLPSGLREPLATITKAVRDADKLDIFPVMLSHLDGSKPPNKVVTMGIKPHPTNFSPAMLEHFKRREVGAYTNMRWHNDFKLLVLTWIYDLNFATSLDLLQKQGYIETVLTSLPPGADMDGVRTKVRSELKRRLQTTLAVQLENV